MYGAALHNDIVTMPGMEVHVAGAVMAVPASLQLMLSMYTADVNMHYNGHVPVWCCLHNSIMPGTEMYCINAALLPPLPMATRCMINIMLNKHTACK